MKKIVLPILILVLIVAMTSTALAFQTREYNGKCKNTFDTLTFGHYISVPSGELMMGKNDHNYKYSHTSGTKVNFSCEQIFNDFSWEAYNQESGASLDSIRNNSDNNVTYHLRLINDFYTGNYMYTQGDYWCQS
jgi:hypothetical protein